MPAIIVHLLDGEYLVVFTALDIEQFRHAIAVGVIAHPFLVPPHKAVAASALACMVEPVFVARLRHRVAVTDRRQLLRVVRRHKAGSDQIRNRLANLAAL